jgi:hypothetical protein
VGWQAETLRLRVQAPPVDGEANAAVATLLARALGVPRAAVTLVGGQRGRDKLARVAGLSDAEVRRRLGR